MKIVERSMDDAFILEMAGRFEFHTTAQFVGALETIETLGCRHLILNLEGVSFVDSAALGLLHFAHRKMASLGGRVSIVNPQPHTQKLLERANFTSIIPIHSVEEQALLVG